MRDAQEPERVEAIGEGLAVEARAAGPREVADASPALAPRQRGVSTTTGMSRVVAAWYLS